MLYHLLYPLRDLFVGFNVVRYITFRTIWAALTALLISLILGPWLIKKLRAMQMDQPIYELSPESHQGKVGTPSMGGILIIFSVSASCLLWARLDSMYVWLCFLVMLGFGAIGFIDDYRKEVSKKNTGGLSVRAKLILQTLMAIGVAVALLAVPGYNTQLTVPFFKLVVPDLGWGYVPLAVFIMVGASNAVNLTDGLDGLAAGPVLIAAGTYLVLSYLAGHIVLAGYLQIFHVPGVAEVTVFLGAVAGAVMGFLWYNTHPAEIFMGDTGSLSLGAILGFVALATKQEILLALVGGLFVIEALSVILQVGFFKMTHGKRIFRMAPLHHHFELSGWAESKVIVRFWIVAIVLALAAISTLKLR